MKIDETLSLAKELHSHSIINGDTYCSDKLLQMIINLSTIGEVKSLESNDLNYEDEIAKVKRKVPKWIKKTHQYNYLILKSFIDISDNNEHRVTVDELEEYVDIGQSFLANYNNLKTISDKNHAKVFDEADKIIELWEPVAEFIEELFIDVNILESDKIKSYIFDGKEYKKNNKSGMSLQNLLFDIFKKYLENNVYHNYNDLQTIFNPLHVNFSKKTNKLNVIFNEQEYNAWYDGNPKVHSNHPRHFEPVIYNDEKIYFTTEWGDTNGDITNFINFAQTKLGFDIRNM